MSGLSHSPDFTHAAIRHACKRHTVPVTHIGLEWCPNCEWHTQQMLPIALGVTHSKTVSVMAVRQPAQKSEVSEIGTSGG